MVGMSELWVFAGLIVLGQFSPGPDMLLLTRTALRDGSRAGLQTALGIACGLVVHATIAVGGMAVVFLSFPALRRVLQWAAAIYLLWLAFGMLRSAIVKWRGDGMDRTAVKENVHPPFVRGLLCNLLNPKVALFLAAVCAPFLTGIHPGWWPYVIWGVVVGLGAGLWSLWVLMLQWPPLRKGYEKASLWIDALFGVTLAILAVTLICNG